MADRLPPADKSWSPAARKLWRAVHSDYVLAEDRSVLLAQACTMITRADAAKKILADGGLTVVDSRGTMREHPAVSIERQATNSCRLLLRELGLNTEAGNPDERSRISRTSEYA